MLVKKLKAVASEGIDSSTEERYILTADIDHMAKLVGLPSDIVRNAINQAMDNPNATYYGEAHNADYFQHLCNVWETIKPQPRKLELDNIHLRVSDRIKTDASGSFLIVPTSVVNPELVGDVSTGYELIPHIVLESWEENDRFKITACASIFRPLADSFVSREVTKPFATTGFRLVGFDLLLEGASEQVNGRPSEFQVTLFNHPRHGNPNCMVYDFGYGVELRVETDFIHKTTTLSVWRNEMLMYPEKEFSLEVAVSVITGPARVINEIIVDSITSLRAVEFARETNHLPNSAENYAVMEWLVTMLAKGYTGIGWRN